MQCFAYKNGNHGYKLGGLEMVDGALQSAKYKVWSCIPERFYEETKFQNWLTKDDTVHTLPEQKDRVLVAKLEQYVVEVDFWKY
jgi:hypothetical protein